MIHRNASIIHLAACAGIVALLLVLAGASGLAQSSAGPATPPQYELGQPISLDKEMALTVELRKPQAATITADVNRTIAWGPEVVLKFANHGKENVEQLLIAGIKPDDSQVVLMGRMNKEIAPVAMKIEQKGGIGYRSVGIPGGIMITGGCIDNGPVGMTRKNRPVGVAGTICTEPGETDTVLVMFGPLETLRKAEAKSIRVSCPVCPKGGLLVKADFSKL